MVDQNLNLKNNIIDQGPYYLHVGKHIGIEKGVSNIETKLTLDHIKLPDQTLMDINRKFLWSKKNL